MCSYQCLNWIMGNDLTEVMLCRQLSGTRGQNQFWIHISHGQKITRCHWRPPLGEISRGLKSRGVGKKGRWERRVCWVGWREDSESVSTPHLLSSLLAAAAKSRGDWASPVARWVKNLPVVQKTQVQPLHQEDPLEKGKAAHSNILAWSIARTEDLDGLQSVGHKSQPRLSD